MASKVTSTHPSTSLKAISLKGDNQKSIALAHNPVYHVWTKHINIKPDYICDKVAAGRINLQYIPINKIIADGLTKAFTQVKFHIFIKRMNMN